MTFDTIAFTGSEICRYVSLAIIMKFYTCRSAMDSQNLEMRVGSDLLTAGWAIKYKKQKRKKINESFMSFIFIPFRVKY